MADETKPSPTEQLLAYPLANMLRDMGLAVAHANKQMADIEKASNVTVMKINKAEIEIKVALSVQKETKKEFEGGLNISAFNVNASYSNTFGFKEEASSNVKVTFAVLPANKEPQ